GAAHEIPSPSSKTRQQGSKHVTTRQKGRTVAGTPCVGFNKWMRPLRRMALPWTEWHKLDRSTATHCFREPFYSRLPSYRKGTAMNPLCAWRETMSIGRSQHLGRQTVLRLATTSSRLRRSAEK